MSPADYLQKNKEAWNRKTKIHLDSEFYDVPSFMAGKNSLNTIELGLLGNVTGKKVLHLQCHFGMDTLSLARMGATVTGVDLSDEAVAAANKLAKDISQPAEFICCDVYSVPERLHGRFDIVFTSYGTIGWLPDLDKWAAVIVACLKPGGRLVFADFHPFIWMFDPTMKEIVYDYFNTHEIVEVEQGTYADRDAGGSFETVGWNHNLAEVFTALQANGLHVTAFKEYDYSPYDCFNEMEPFEEGRYRFKNIKSRIPMVFSFVAEKEKL
jgi:2-polyprenyl-3-methyl-5-hydroxy-6-metoxy-1,4-benzoquinol methylase